MAVELGNGDVTFQHLVKYDTTAGALAITVADFGITSADFNQDGKPDLAVSAGLAQSLWVLLNTGAQ